MSVLQSLKPEEAASSAHFDMRDGWPHSIIDMQFYGRFSRFMRSMLFQISAYDPKNFPAVVAVLSAVVLLACSIPALRATRVDPVVAMRNE